MKVKKYQSLYAELGGVVKVCFSIVLLRLGLKHIKQQVRLQQYKLLPSTQNKCGIAEDCRSRRPPTAGPAENPRLMARRIKDVLLVWILFSGICSQSCKGCRSKHIRQQHNCEDHESDPPELFCKLHKDVEIYRN
jgi:hypothetical protein